MTQQPGNYYTEHAGTIRISGSTIPRHAAGCAWHFLQSADISSVDFVCVGANANQQATKAMGIVAYDFRHAYAGSILSFIPMRFLTRTQSPDNPQVFKDKDCTVWRSVISAPAPSANITAKETNENKLPVAN